MHVKRVDIVEQVKQGKRIIVVVRGESFSLTIVKGIFVLNSSKRSLSYECEYSLRSFLRVV